VRLLEKKGVVVGSVVGREGRPAYDSVVRLHETWPGPTQLSPDGTFRFGLRPGTYEIEAYSRPGGLSERVPITVVAGETTGPVRLVLRPAARIAGRILSPSGEPVAGARVWTLESTDPLDMMGVHTDRSGRFLLGPFRPGRYIVHADHRDWIETTHELELADGEVGRPEIRLGGESGAIRVRVVGADGRPRTDYRLALRTADGERVRAYSFPFEDESQRWLRATGGRIVSDTAGIPLLELGSLPPGRYEVEVTAGAAVGRAEAVVLADGVTEVLVRLR